MTKLVTILKWRRGPQGPSLRTLRRAIRPVRVKVGVRVVFFLILLSLFLGTVGIAINLKIEKWEREHSSHHM
ncbi:MAG TPA: hypothetical protein VGG66_11330 [Rhizomicrobium sp.]